MRICRSRTALILAIALASSVLAESTALAGEEPMLDKDAVRALLSSIDAAVGAGEWNTFEQLYATNAALTVFDLSAVEPKASSFTVRGAIQLEQSRGQVAIGWRAEVAELLISIDTGNSAATVVRAFSESNWKDESGTVYTASGKVVYEIGYEHGQLRVLNQRTVVESRAVQQDHETQ